jgi:hypothetical protein
MVTCCVAFGPDDSYLFNSPSKWAWKGVPEDVRKLMAVEPKAADINEVSFGPDGSYLCVYTKKGGGMMLARSGLPESLNKWLVPIAGKGVSAKRDLGSLNVALGPKRSFFAFDKNGAFWSGLPDALEKAIAAKRDTKGNFKSGEYPQSIALGADDTYVLTTVGGGGAWTLTDDNKALREFLKAQKSLKNIVGLSLSFKHTFHSNGKLVYYSLSSSFRYLHDLERLRYVLQCSSDNMAPTVPRIFSGLANIMPTRDQQICSCKSQSRECAPICQCWKITS